jgi:hypothetical protein
MLNAPTELASSAQIPTVEASVAEVPYQMAPEFTGGPAPTDAMINSGIDPSIAKGPYPTDAMMNSGFTPPGPAGPPVDYGLTYNSGIMQGVNAPLNIAQPSQYSLGNQYGNYNLANSVPSPAATATANPAPTGIEAGFNKALKFVKDSPFSAASMGINAMQFLGGKEKKEEPEEYSGPLSKYKLSPNFKGRIADPGNYQYTPKVYAEGGIASYRSGGDLSKELERYEKMMQTKAPAKERSDVGIVYDTDPDTRSLDALTAAQIRMAKVAKRANMQLPATKRPTPMGQINLVPVTMKASPNAPDTTDAAQGGVMSLGGYAAGGNPRLLKGPGDGMSDNIPATIAGKQPARLADGEFVIPADVVSHLGNGSTEAGAKKLHKMMNDVRKARTGNSKQGKQINPNKFMPK